MFLTENDYKPVISQREFDVLQQSDPAIRNRAEVTAIEEISSYLRARFDATATFAAEGDDRNPLIVQIAVNITLFYLVKALPNKLGSANRDEMYKAAIDYLKGVQKGTISPLLPIYEDPNTNTPGVNGRYPFQMGTMKKQGYDY